MTESDGVPCAGSLVETMIQVRVQVDPGVVVVAVRGEVDLLTAPRLAAAVTEQADGRAGVLVADLSEVAFFGAAGLEALAQAQQRAAAAGVSLRLVVGPHVSRLLSLLDPERPLPAYESLAQAVR